MISASPDWKWMETCHDQWYGQENHPVFRVFFKLESDVEGNPVYQYNLFFPDAAGHRLFPADDNVVCSPEPKNFEALFGDDAGKPSEKLASSASSIPKLAASPENLPGPDAETDAGSGPGLFF